MRTIRALLLAVALPAGAASPGLPPGVEPPAASLSDIRLIEVTPAAQIFALKLRVRNPNLFDLSLRSLRYQVDLDGREIVHGITGRPVILPGLGERIVEVQAVTSIGAAIRQIDAMMRNGTLSAGYRIHGSIRLGNGTVPFPFEQSGRIDLRHLLGLDGAPAARTGGGSI